MGKMMLTDNLDNFTRAYIRAALWSTTEYDSENSDLPHYLDEKFDETNIAAESLLEIIADCAKFQEENHLILKKAYSLYTLHPDAPTPEHCAGHDFLLTRNGNGVGFLERTELGALGDLLTEKCKVFEQMDFYVVDDNRVYVS